MIELSVNKFSTNIKDIVGKAIMRILKPDYNVPHPILKSVFILFQTIISF